MEMRVAGDGIDFPLPVESQSMIAGWRKTQEVKGSACYAEVISGDFVHYNLIGWLLEARCSKDTYQAIDQLAYANWTVDVQVALTRISLRPRSGLHERDEVRDVVGMKMR